MMNHYLCPAPLKHLRLSLPSRRTATVRCADTGRVARWQLRTASSSSLLDSGSVMSCRAGLGHGSGSSSGGGVPRAFSLPPSPVTAFRRLFPCEDPHQERAQLDAFFARHMPGALACPREWRLHGNMHGSHADFPTRARSSMHAPTHAMAQASMPVIDVIHCTLAVREPDFVAPALMLLLPAVDALHDPPTLDL